MLLLFVFICTAEACFLKDNADSIASVLSTNNIKDADLARAVVTNFKTLKTSADTRDAHYLYQFLGALLMTGQKSAIQFHDAILESGYRRDSDTLRKLVGLTWGNAHLHAHDEHIISARFKAGNLIDQALGIKNFAAQQTPWQSHQNSLFESLTKDEKDNLTVHATLGSIIGNVLIPDTLLLGMHPFQGSVYEGRPSIFFNPRVQYVDMNAINEQKELAGLTSEILRDLKRRTFAINYGDAALGQDDTKAFVLGRKQQYNRIILDWSSLCGVDNSFLFWQNLLKKGRYVYAQDLYELKLHSQPNPEANIPGGMPCKQIEFGNVPAADNWFVNQAKHPHPEWAPQERNYLQQYQRTNEALKEKIETTQATKPLSDEGKKALLAKARNKQKGYQNNPDGLIELLLGQIDVNGEMLKVSRADAEEAVAEILAE